MNSGLIYEAFVANLYWWMPYTILYKKSYTVFVFFHLYSYVRFCSIASTCFFNQH